MKMAVIMPPRHWRRNQVNGLVCFTDDHTIYDPWVEKLVGSQEDGGYVWLYARKRRDGHFTCKVTVMYYGGGSVLYERDDHTSLGAACRDAERWFTENAEL